MYLSIRECLLIDAFGSIRGGLDAVGIDAVEFEYSRDRSVLSPDSTKGEMVSLADKGAIDAFAAKCKELNVKVSALLLHNNFAAEDLDAELDWVMSCIKAADQLGVKAVRIDAIMSTEAEWSLEQRVQRFADCMAKILDATSDCDVEMGIENHGQRGNEPEFIETVLNKVNSPRLGLTIDTANLYWYGHPLSKVHEIIEQFAPRVKHTHIKNINYPEELREIQRELGWKYESYVCPLREGDIDLKWTIDTLRKAGYEGDLCVEDESFIRWDAQKKRDVFIDDIAYLKEIL